MLSRVVRDRRVVADLSYLGVLGAEKISPGVYVAGKTYVVLRGEPPLEILSRKAFTHSDILMCTEVYGRSVAVPGPATEYIEAVAGHDKYLCVPAGGKPGMGRRDVVAGITVGDVVVLVSNYRLYNVLRRRRWRRGEVLATRDGTDTYIVLDYGVLRLYIPVEARLGRREHGLFKVYFY